MLVPSTEDWAKRPVRPGLYWLGKRCGGEIGSAPTMALSRRSEVTSARSFTTIWGPRWWAWDALKRGLQAFRQAARLDPKMAGAFANIGRVYVQHGRQIEAIAALQRAVELEPGNGAIFALLGQAYEEMGQWDEAQQSYYQAVECAPKSVAYRINLAYAYQELGQPRQAENSYRAAIALNEESIPPL